MHFVNVGIAERLNLLGKDWLTELGATAQMSVAPAFLATGSSMRTHERWMQSFPRSRLCSLNPPSAETQRCR
jgi:hypothetical protein